MAPPEVPPGEAPTMAGWRCSVLTDPTALGKLYLSFELYWIYVPPMLLFWKVAMLVPAVFIERNTFEQTVGISVVQFLRRCMLLRRQRRVP